jgi:hypothetical protein
MVRLIAVALGSVLRLNEQQLPELLGSEVLARFNVESERQPLVADGQL